MERAIPSYAPGKIASRVRDALTLGRQSPTAGGYAIATVKGGYAIAGNAATTATC